MAIIAGFKPFDTPATGTFYAFIDRLEDGPYQKPCQHIVKPSKLRKGKHLRNLNSEKQQRQESKKGDLTVYDSVTKKLKNDLKASENQLRPDDLLKRLEDILIQCAIIPSANRGLLGDTNSINISGDGSALTSGANPQGKPSCNCREKGIYDCNCPRYYSDPTVNWGYDSYRDTYYFGHTFYQHIVSANGHDLPLDVSTAPASETDFTLSLNSLDRLKKALRRTDWNGRFQTPSTMLVMMPLEYMSTSWMMKSTQSLPSIPGNTSGSHWLRKDGQREWNSHLPWWNAHEKAFLQQRKASHHLHMPG